MFASLTSRQARSRGGDGQPSGPKLELEHYYVARVRNVRAVRVRLPGWKPREVISTWTRNCRSRAGPITGGIFTCPFYTDDASTLVRTHVVQARSSIQKGAAVAYFAALSRPMAGHQFGGVPEAPDSLLERGPLTCNRQRVVINGGGQGLCRPGRMSWRQLETGENRRGWTFRDT